MVEQGGADTSTYVFKQQGRDVHLVTHYLVNLSIVYCTAKLIGGYGMADVGLKGEVYGEGIAQQTLLGQYTVVGMEGEVA